MAAALLLLEAGLDYLCDHALPLLDEPFEEGERRRIQVLSADFEVLQRSLKHGYVLGRDHLPQGVREILERMQDRASSGSIRHIQ